MPNGTDTKKSKTDRRDWSDEKFLAFSKSKSGKKQLKTESCVRNLTSRGYGPERAQEICSKGVIRTMGSDIKKAGKAVVGKVKKVIKKGK
jgi:hypothetical protein